MCCHRRAIRVTLPPLEMCPVCYHHGRAPALLWSAPHCLLISSSCLMPCVRSRALGVGGIYTSVRQTCVFVLEEPNLRGKDKIVHV